MIQESSMSTAPIICNGLSKRFGNTIALEDVTLKIDKPCVVGLVGPNGSGKSTLLRLLMGSIKPSRGDVLLFGRSPRETRQRYTEVGYLGASDRMFPDLTVLENMIYRAQFYNLRQSEAAETAAMLLRDRRLYSLRDRSPTELSTGQRRQVCLLSSLLHKPKVLLLDEPTTGIDMLAINQIYALMAELCADDCTIVLATHHLEELVTLCQQTIALNDGQLVQHCETEQLGNTRTEVRNSLQELFHGRSLPTDGRADLRLSPRRRASAELTAASGHRFEDDETLSGQTVLPQQLRGAVR